MIWCGFYDYAKNIGINFDNNKLDLFLNFNSQISFIIPYKGICFISEKPEKILWNENKFLHSDKDMAVKYPDGYGMWMFRGVKVNQQIIQFPESLKIKQIEKEKNLEVQRIMIERMGYDKFFEQSDADILDRDNLGKEGSGDRILIQTKSGLRYMICTDGSTGRVYYIAASNKENTCSEVFKAMCGFNDKLIFAEG